MADRRFRIEADRSLCVSSRSCSAALPSVFGLGDDDKVTVIDPDGTSSHATLDDIVEAAISCPVGAISVVDMDTGEDLVD
jgi:ferredoxin